MKLKTISPISSLAMTMFSNSNSLHILLLLKHHSMINIPSILTLFCNRFVTKHQHSVCTQMILSESGTHRKSNRTQHVKRVTYYTLIENWILRDELWFPNATWPSIWHIYTTCFWWKLKDCLLGLVKNYQLNQMPCLLSSVALKIQILYIFLNSILLITLLDPVLPSISIFFKDFFILIFGCSESSLLVWASSSCGKWGLLFMVVRGLLAVVSLVVEHTL